MEAIQPHVIHPNAIYTLDQARRLLGLRVNGLRREAREGRLVLVRRCKVTFIMGQHLLDWLAAGAIKKPAHQEPA